MDFWKIGLGVALFLSSAMIGDLLAMTGLSLFWGSTDYAPSFVAKLLDTMAGSLVIWGVLDIKKKKKGRR